VRKPRRCQIGQNPKEGRAREDSREGRDRRQDGIDRASLFGEPPNGFLSIDDGESETIAGKQLGGAAAIG
jgi:hypothetical protein